MTRYGCIALLALLLWAGLPGGSRAQALTEGAAQAVAKSQAVIGRVVGEHRLLKADGQTVRLSDYRGQPLVISLIYTSCYHTCPTITQTVVRAVQSARKALGTGKFRVLSIGFDSRTDTPEAMRRFGRQQGADMAEWEFLSIDPETMSALAEELGFTYFASPRGFDHLTQTTILDKDGRVYRQVYGEVFDLPHLVEPLKDLVLGRTAAIADWETLVNRVRLFCTVYDPRTDGYRIDIGIFVESALGLIAVISIAYFLIYAWRSSRAARPEG